MPHAVAVADVDDVAMVNQPVDKRARHDVIAEDFAPLFKAFIGS